MKKELKRWINADVWIDKLQNVINDEDAPSEYKDYCLHLVNEIEAEFSAQGAVQNE